MYKAGLWIAFVGVALAPGNVGVGILVFAAGAALWTLALLIDLLA